MMVLEVEGMAPTVPLLCTPRSARGGGRLQAARCPPQRPETALKRGFCKKKIDWGPMYRKITASVSVFLYGIFLLYSSGSLFEEYFGLLAFLFRGL